MTELRTVLLVDDDQSCRGVMEYQLREDGYRVLVPPMWHPLQNHPEARAPATASCADCPRKLFMFNMIL